MMFETALTLRQTATQKKILYKTLVSAGLIALAVALPQLVHLTLGQPGGIQWLPMYLPVLIGGCLLGSGWALAVGVLSPLVSFWLTSAAGDPMPAAVRLPFMMAELAVFAVVAGLFSKKIADRAIWALPAVLCAQIAGRASFLGLVVLFRNAVPFTPEMIWEQIQTGWYGLAVQLVLVPPVIAALRSVLMGASNHD